MTADTRTDRRDEGEPGPHATCGGDRAALGLALRARSDSIATEVAALFPVHLRTELGESARSATEVVGQWLATGARGTAHDRRELGRASQKAMLLESDLGTAVRGYLTWRDLCCAALTEDAARLGVGEDTVAVARTFVQLSCDGGLVRTVRAFDESWQAMQKRLVVQQHDLSRQILHDDLTGLPNRILLCDRLRRASRSGERRKTASMVLFCDLDNFTAINDRFGQSAGDAVLVEVARRLRELARGSDTVARLGGDEFVILAEDLEGPEEAARSLAERIHQAMCDPVTVGQRELHTSVSIGITEVSDELEPEELLARADAAMFGARRSGPARFAVYEVALGVEHRREGQLDDDLRVAHGRGELFLAYQPVFRQGRGGPGGICGMEALLRWDHPELGQVEPGVFVPLLEQSRQIVPVGRWVLEEAASQAVDWQRRVPDLVMSVNVSPRQLHDPGFLEDVDDALHRSGLDPAHLVLEVAEAALAVDVVRIGAVMQTVRDLGVRIALDNFGTGHSSLLYLQGLPIDRLKVDRTFVEGLDEAGHGGTVIRTVVDLAHRLGITVVAQGVETAAELRAVTAVGCDEVQGFLLGRPIAPHQVTFDFDHQAAPAP